MNLCEVTALRHMDEGTRLFTAVRLPETTTTYLYFISLQQGQEVREGQVSLAHSNAFFWVKKMNQISI